MAEKDVLTLIEQKKNETRPFELSLSRRDLTRLPKEIGQLKMLTKLDLSRNQLISLPPEIGLLENLTHLDLAYNPLTELPPELGKLKNLKKLDVRSNPLYNFPTVIYELTGLTHLVLERCFLLSLPAGIGRLQNLVALDLRDNTLRELPTDIGELKKLSRLYVYNNQLTELPGEVGQLENLSELLAYDNLLTGLPNELGKLKGLMSLNVDGNPFESQGLRAALNLGLEQTLQYLRSKSVHRKTLKVETEYRLPLQQYLIYFKEYARLALDEPEFHLEIRETTDGLELETQADNDGQLKQIDAALAFYLNLIEQISFDQKIEKLLPPALPDGLRNYFLKTLPIQTTALTEILKAKNLKLGPLARYLAAQNRIESFFRN